jgi:hypothetical protein
MEQNGYQRSNQAGNSEMTIFMKVQGSDFIIHGLFVDEMMHFLTCDKLRDEFLAFYQKDFENTGGTSEEALWKHSKGQWQRSNNQAKL